MATASKIIKKATSYIGIKRIRQDLIKSNLIPITMAEQ